jgi:energy-coupling factor transporter ATP-binding protein EcfA2
MTDHHSSSHSSAGSSGSHSSSGASHTPAQPLSADQNINFFGLTNFRNQYRKFGIKVDDRLRHVYVIGKSGMGKSTLLETMIVNDIYAGHGVGIIDPHGDLAENILRYMPEHRTKDVIYFNPGDLDFPVGFNILETVPPEVHGRISDGIRGLFKKIWPDVWSPRMENILNNVILALLEFPGASLMSINCMLADEEYFDQVVAKVQNPAVKLFWTKEYSTWNDKYKQEAIAFIQNKVGQFLSGSLIRNVVAQTKSTFNISAAHG